MLNLERLRVLQAVARHGSVTAAAAELHVTTSAVSQQLTKLERESGATLVERNGRGIRLTDEAHLPEELAAWQNLRGEELCLCFDKQRQPAELVTSRPEDLVIGTAHWLRFAVTPEARRLLADFHLLARFEIDHPGYKQQSELLSEEVRQSLLDDLELSDRDEV